MEPHEQDKLNAFAALSVKECLDKRAALVKENRALIDKAEAEKRDLSADETGQYDRRDADIDALSKVIDSKQTAQARKDRVVELERTLKDSAGRQVDPAQPGQPAGLRDTTKRRRATDEYHQLFCKVLAGAPLSDAESLALQSDSEVDGGYSVASEQFATEFVKLVADIVQVRQLARVWTVRDARSLAITTRTAKAATFAWSSEVAAPVADTAMKLGKRKLSPHYLSGEIDVSRDLLRCSTLPIDQIVREELARDAGEAQENAFLTGDGNEKPLGLFTASTAGISTARDVSTGNATTSIGADGLMEALYALKPQYQARASWLFHRAGVKNVRKLKDGNGQYLWQPALTAGEPSLVLGRPVYQSEFAPSTFTTGLYVGIVGDFSNYWIVDQLDMEIQVLVELLARTNQVVYLSRLKLDGAPIREEAFARVKLA